jgi:hypothetical protein
LHHGAPVPRSHGYKEPAGRTADQPTNDTESATPADVLAEAEVVRGVPDSAAVPAGVAHGQESSDLV